MSELEARRELVQAWLDRADQDLHAAELLNQAPASFKEVILFHCQQTAEKALKAYLQWSDVRFPKTHDLTLLLGLCAELAPTFEELAEACQDLRSSAVDPRYPLEDPQEILLDPDVAIEHAHLVRDLVGSSLPPAVDTG
jgi:HEPN domain-containing protein